MEINSFYNPFDVLRFNYKHCFLCGKDLKKESNSIEHVFPKWLLNKFELWDKKFALLNGSKISYRQLTIPCCKSCNSNHLSTLEKRIRENVEKGYSVFYNLDKTKIFQWTGKIFWGILFKELSLLVDQKYKDCGTIMSPKLLEKYKSLHGFLQSIRVPFVFSGFSPWSIFIVKIHTYNEIEKNFDYHDNITALSFSIRMHDIGVIACYEDNGAQEEIFKEYFNKFYNIKLHPVQFDELCAKVTYKNLLLNRVPKYLTIMPETENNVVNVFSPSIQGYSKAPIYDEWDQYTYAKILFRYWDIYGFSFKDVYKEPGMVLSFIDNEDNSLIKLDADMNLITSD